MSRQSNSRVLTTTSNEERNTRFSEHALTEEMQSVVTQIDQIFGDVQSASLTAFWQVGKLITDVQNSPDIYLTPEQKAAHVDGASLIVSIFAPVYTAEQLRGAVTFYERYPSESDLTRLLTLRCPDPERPRWRLTVSHVQLLSQVADEEQREVLENKCAEEAYTARNLALELQELRGKQKNSGRTHRAPKGLKQQLMDLLTHQRRFIARSEKLWLNEDDDNIYDDIANTPPEKFDVSIRSFLAEIAENFDRMGDVVADHVAMCRKINEVLEKIDNESDAEDEEEETSRNTKKKSDITR
jgi:hypothetical protein